MDTAETAGTPQTAGTAGAPTGDPRVAKAFRLTAHVEAGTWVCLLIGMLFKYVLSDNEIGVQVFGPIHGAAFICYVVSTLLAARSFGWSIRLAIVALAASIPPVFTWIFERYATRSGSLT